MTTSTTTTTADVQTLDPVNISIFGQTIALLFGATVVECAPVWAAPVVSNDDGSRVVTYAAIVGKRGPLTETSRLSKIWIDDALIYDNNKSTGIAVDFTFYDGNEQQGPAPEIVAQEGIENTPAFRDRMYIMLRNWVIPVGSKFPVLTVEVVQGAEQQDQRFVHPFAFRPDSSPGSYIIYNKLNSYLLNTNPPLIDEFDTGKYDLYDTGSGTFLFSSRFDGVQGIGASGVSVLMFSKYGGAIYGYTNGFAGPLLHAWDVSGADQVKPVGYPGDPAGSVNFPNLFDTTFGTVLGAEWIVSCSGGWVEAFRRKRLDKGEPNELERHVRMGTGGISCDTMQLCDMRKAPGEDVVMGYAINGRYLSQFIITDTLGQTDLVQPTQLEFDACQSFAGAPLFGMTATVSVKGGTQYDVVADIQDPGVKQADDETFTALFVSPDASYVVVLSYSPSASQSWYRRYATPLGAITGVGLQYTTWANGARYPLTDIAVGAKLKLLAQYPIPGVSPTFPSSYNAKLQSPPGQSKYIYVELGTSNLIVMEMNDGSWSRIARGNYVLASDTSVTYGGASGLNDNCIYDADLDLFYYPHSIGVDDTPGYVTVYEDGETQGQLLISNLVIQLGILAGFDASDIVCTGFETDRVVGSIINVAGSDFIAIASQLAALFRIDIIESEGKLKFNRAPRGADFAVARTLTELDLAPVDQGAGDDGTLLSKDRNSTADLPSALEVDYLDSGNDFQVGMQVARRTQYPYRTSAGTNVQTISVPIAMAAKYALYWGEFSLYDQWAGALTLTGLVAVAHLDLEPGDYVELNTEFDGTYIVKLTKVSLNQDWSISFEASTVVTETPANDTLNDIDVASSDPVSGAGTTKFNLVAVGNIAIRPYTVDQATDNCDLAVIGSQPIDAKVFHPDNTYSYLQLTQPCIVGVIRAIAAPYDFETPDENAITIFVATSGAALVPVSDAGFLSGFNVALIGNTDRWEMIWFRDVLRIDDNTFTLSHVLRGRNGSDTFNKSRPGDFFVSLNGSVPAIVGMSIAGIPYAATIVANNQGASSAGTQQRAVSQVVGGSLKPWSPVHVRAAHSGADVVLTWVRRDRLPNALHDGDDMTPMSEVTEAYDLEILDATGTVKRTCSDLVAATYIYTSAQIASDGLDVSTVIRINVYQLSATVGRGNVRNVSCPIT